MISHMIMNMLMTETRSLPLICASTILVVIMTPLVASFLTPWQLFQQLCPYFGAQSPQCTMLQQQQALSSSPYTTGGAPSSSSSSPGDPFSSSAASLP